MGFNPLYFVPLSWLNAMLPHFVKVGVLSKVTMDNTNEKGRPELKNLEGKIEETKLQLAGRLAGAHSNGLEVFAYFAPGVVAAVAAGAPRSTTNALCGVHLGSRVLYNVVYSAKPVLNGYLRTLVFAVSVASASSLWILAAANLD